jgi:general secretion pathway protein K
MTPARRETGAALLTVLLLVAVIGALAVVSLEKLRIATRLATNMAAADQSRAYAFAAESIATFRIADLVARDRERTTLDGDWQGRPIPLPIDQGSATALLNDGGNCFNLNSLVTGQPQTGLSVRLTGVRQFVALMRLLDIREGNAQRIAASTADWIDSDSNAEPGGAEDGVYRDYRTANTLIADPSELRAVAGVSAEVYTRLRPWICALPDTDLSPLNINTLRPDQAPLVAMLLPGQLDLARAKRIIDERPKAGYSKIVDFWKLPALVGQTPPPDVFAQPQLKTRWFVVDLNIELAGAELREIALIDGALSPARLVHRTFGDPS